jgi:hypothetical protein
MPYRRLPNTDNARLRALKSAFTIGNKLPPFKLAYSQTLFQKLKHFLPDFENTMIHQKEAFRNQVKYNSEYISVTRKARLYISHFFQVLNLAINRGELSPATRMYFDIKENDKKIPSLLTEADIIFWGKKIILGEQERISKGLNPITNPTFGIVSVRYEKYLEAQRYQKSLQNTNSRSLNKIAQLRKDADELVLNIWNEVEASYSNLSENEKREQSSVYGVVYVFRSNEKTGQKELFDNDSDIISEKEVIAENNLNKERQNILMNSIETKKVEDETPEIQYSFFFNND